MVKKIKKEDLESKLSSEEFYVTQNQGTEPAFTGKYNDEKSQGSYECICCGKALFSSKTKYESGSGWPSFWQPLNEFVIETEQDSSSGMMRTEVHCSSCKAHLGHVFSDGPQPTGLRYCINSISLNLKKEGAKD
jgi:peptide-methionine (R)-S-oxide reductase|tara:strand:- start:2046 stop:2447 length:402 start_codon:yes stop_codon:yes gene_type:complete